MKHSHGLSPPAALSVSLTPSRLSFRDCVGIKASCRMLFLLPDKLELFPKLEITPRKRLLCQFPGKYISRSATNRSPISCYGFGLPQTHLVHLEKKCTLEIKSREKRGNNSGNAKNQKAVTRMLKVNKMPFERFFFILCCNKSKGLTETPASLQQC